MFNSAVGLVFGHPPKHSTRAPFPAAERRGLRVYRYGLERGAVLRPLGNVVYFMPPYCITPEEIDFMVDVAVEGITAATA